MTQPPKRRPDWPERLRKIIEAARTRPFSWGKHDCCLFACDAVKAMTGTDPAKPFRGRYKTKRGAFGALKRFAGGGVLETAQKITDELAFSEIPVSLAGRGDVVLARVPMADGGEGDALGVVSMDAANAVFTGPEGMAFVPVKECSHAWRIN